MHTYQRRWADDPSARVLPRLSDFRFNNALDVVLYAELDWLVTWRTYPDVWHLDDDGTFRCGSKGSSLDSVRGFAENPSTLLRCREVVLDEPCPDRWLVIEPHHPWRKDRYRVDEGDAGVPHASPAPLRRARHHPPRRDGLRPGVPLVVAP
jgi:hypothetical protein